MGGATVSLPWSRIFSLSWIVGFVGGSVIYYILCKISPPPGAPYVTEYLDMVPADDIISGVPEVIADGDTGTITPTSHEKV